MNEEKKGVLCSLVSLSYNVSFFARLVLRTKINTFSYDGIFSPRELATGRDDWLPNTQIEPGQVNSRA